MNNMWKVTKIVAMVAVMSNMVLMLSACGGNSGSASGSGGFQKWNGQQVADAFKGAGLEAEDVKAFDDEDKSKAPDASYDGTRFFIPSLGEGSGGRIFAAHDQASVDTLKGYYEGLGKQSPLLKSWVYTHDNVVVQINGSLPEDQAKKYELALASLK